VDSINACAAALGQNVQVVAPDEFVKLIMANLGNNLPNSLISVGEISSAKKGPSQGQGFTGVHFEHRDAQGRAILGKLAPK
jgi:hypothetical protein